jgi:hypothetical protein
LDEWHRVLPSAISRAEARARLARDGDERRCDDTGTIPNVRLRRIISGGQTGVDRAALRLGLERGLEIGGFVPESYRAEDGYVPEPFRSHMTCLPGGDYSERTRRNVLASDATLVLVGRGPSAGTDLTVRECANRGRPHLVVCLDVGDADQIKAWLAEVNPAVLNVAGPRESEAPGVGDAAYGLLAAVFEQ